MPAPRPLKKPQATLAEVLALIEPHRAEIKPTDNVICVMVRGYFRDTMGKPGTNDVGQYDDAGFWIATHDRHFSSWRANTDPSRLGWNPHANGYMARLRPGVWRFMKWHHKRQYWAFGQGPNPVTIDRVKEDGTVARTMTGIFGINLHQGGDSGTSSEGCLTIPKQGGEWQDFKDTGYSLLDRYQPPGSFPLILIARPDA